MTKLRFSSYSPACSAVWYVLSQGSNQPSTFSIFMFDSIKCKAVKWKNCNYKNLEPSTSATWKFNKRCTDTVQLTSAIKCHLPKTISSKKFEKWAKIKCEAVLYYGLSWWDSMVFMWGCKDACLQFRVKRGLHCPPLPTGYPLSFSHTWKYTHFRMADSVFSR